MERVTGTLAKVLAWRIWQVARPQLTACGMGRALPVLDTLCPPLIKKMLRSVLGKAASAAHALAQRHVQPGLSKSLMDFFRSLVDFFRSRMPYRQPARATEV